MSQRRSTGIVLIARWRLTLACVLLFALWVALFWHLALLQVVPGMERGFEFLQGQGDARTVRYEAVPANRGIITDRNGDPLAVSTPLVAIWGNPLEMDFSPAALVPLASQLDMSVKQLQQRLNKYRGKEFVYLKRKVTPQKAEKILSGGWKGVYGETEYQRFYPAGEVAAHVVGFTDIDERGREGIELAFDATLVGTDGQKRFIRDARGGIIRDDGMVKAPVSGADIQLSIDLRMQYLAHKALKQAVVEHKAVAASLVMLDTRTGEILAMVNQPSYNPNNRSRINLAALRNRAVTDQIEPGSTMKPLTVLAALESGKYRPNTKIDTNPGWIHLGTKTLLDPKNYGVMDVTRVITKSSQVGLSKIALDLEIEQIRDMFFRMGLGQATATGFQGESVGVLPNRSRWTSIERANFAFGYGMSATPLQLAQAYAVIANRGIKKPVSLLKQDEVVSGVRVVEEQYADQLVEMLKTVLGKEGTASKSQIEAYPAAGKTGTVHKLDGGTYSADSYRSVFAGIAPADDPRIAMVVVVEDPRAGKYFGGEVAAPVFSKVAEGTLRMMKVQPQITKSQSRSASMQASRESSRGPMS